jgi:hypothetical protein
MSSKIYSPIPPKSRLVTSADFPLIEPLYRKSSLVAGVVGALLFHLFYVLSIPSSYLILDPSERSQSAKEFDIEIVSAPEEEKALPKYVETNPNAPDNIPDETINESSRNQQAANPDPVEELSPDRSPSSKSDDDIPSEKILSGDLEVQPLAAASPSVEQPESEASEPREAGDPRKTNPLPGYEEDEVVSEEGTGMMESEDFQDVIVDTEKVVSEDNESKEERPLMVQTNSQPNRPSPRPRSRVVRVPPGPLKDQRVGVSKTGEVRPDSKLSEYGEYMERLIEAVKLRWDHLSRKSPVHESNSFVKIEFKLTKEGLVRELEVVDTTSSPMARLNCRKAVSDGQPYEKWSKEMITVFGEEQIVKFRFIYR